MTRLALLAVLLAACGGKKAPVGEDAPQGVPTCANPVSGTNVTLRKIGTVVGGAMLATAPPDDKRLFVIEQRGAIRIFNDEQLLPDPFLDLSPDAPGPVLAGGEEGLLGLAFHPQYATNGQFFVFYTTQAGGAGLRDVLARCHVSATDPNRAEPTCTEVLSIPDFAGNHNGGMIEFGADGYLYIGTGDGGNAGDPQRNGQDPNKLLAKMLRIDIDSRTRGEYGIPADNPYANGGGAPEVYILGLRNPWRWSFDRGTGDLYIGDVGQDLTEELDVLRAGQQAGKNLGWSAFEAQDCCSEESTTKCEQSSNFETCNRAVAFFPQDSRAHTTGWTAIIGGQVYRGTCYPDLVGWYFYTDNGKSGLTKAKLNPDGSLEIHDLPGTWPGSPASLHADAHGELYETTTSGDVFHLEVLP